MENRIISEFFEKDYEIKVIAPTLDENEREERLEECITNLLEIAKQLKENKDSEK